MQRKVLLIEHQEPIRRTLNIFLSNLGYQVLEIPSAFEGYSICESESPFAVLLDLDLPDGHGFKVLERIKRHWSQTVIIAMSGNSGANNIPVAEHRTVFYFLSKPIDRDLLQRSLLNGFAARLGQIKIVGQSCSAYAMLDFISKAASNDASVLLEGETGTGKELMAQAIHVASARARGPLVAVNCGAINTNLIESELFGHERGAFTGAIARKLGHFERANGGTLFLDEVAELSLLDQVKLLRVLQEHRFERVGGTKEINVDFRVIAATNRDLLTEVKAGRFRLDLYYRLAVITFGLFSLRERRDDILPLARHFLTIFSKRIGRAVPNLTPRAEAALVQYDWPGNIRELKNVIERALALVGGAEIDIESLVFQTRLGGKSTFNHSTPNAATDNRMLLPAGVKLDDLARSERCDLIRQAFRLCYGNHTCTAKLLGLSSRYQLYRLVNKLGISGEIRVKR